MIICHHQLSHPGIVALQKKNSADAQLYQEGHLTFNISHFYQRHRECNFSKSATGAFFPPSSPLLQNRFPFMKYGGDVLELDQS